MSYLFVENASMNDKKHPELAKSDVSKRMPKACGDETAAVEFFERQRWGNSPVCPHCQSANLHQLSGLVFIHFQTQSLSPTTTSS
jgi:hypothetical protein